jgi:hypothetical protein
MAMRFARAKCSAACRKQAPSILALRLGPIHCTDFTRRFSGDWQKARDDEEVQERRGPEPSLGSGSTLP